MSRSTTNRTRTRIATRARRTALAVLLVLLLPAIGATQQIGSATDRGGIIFNYSGSSIDVTSYQGGIGLKLQRGEIGNRFHGDLAFSVRSNVIDIGFGYTREQHLVAGIAQPYIGWTTRAQIVRRRTETDVDNWQVDITVPIAIGPVLGVELRPNDFLGIFAEYEIVGSIGLEIDRSSSNGNVQSASDYDVFIDAGLGNNGRVGMVVYFPVGFLREP